MAENTLETGAGIEIVRITPELAERAVAVLVEAFKNEEATSYEIDTSRQGALRRMGTLDGIYLQLYLESGRPLLAAMKGVEVVGVGILRDPRIPLSRRRVASLVLRNLVPLAALFAPRPLRALRVEATAQPPKSLTRPYFTFEALGVHPDYHGQGVGSALMREAQARIKAEAAISGMYLNTGSAKNQGFYESHGYHTLRIDDLGPVKVYHMFWTNPTFQRSRG
ncbi:MAG: GNAT family N-acetyltransferase [Actinomycetota bacterium]